jgi:hypothetical protein
LRAAPPRASWGSASTTAAISASEPDELDDAASGGSAGAAVVPVSAAATVPIAPSDPPGWRAGSEAGIDVVMIVVAGATGFDVAGSGMVCAGTGWTRAAGGFAGAVCCAG